MKNLISTLCFPPFLPSSLLLAHLSHPHTTKPPPSHTHTPKIHGASLFLIQFRYVFPISPTQPRLRNAIGCGHVALREKSALGRHKIEWIQRFLGKLWKGLKYCLTWPRGEGKGGEAPVYFPADKDLRSEESVHQRHHSISLLGGYFTPRTVCFHERPLSFSTPLVWVRAEDWVVGELPRLRVGMGN